MVRMIALLLMAGMAQRPDSIRITRGDTMTTTRSRKPLKVLASPVSAAVILLLAGASAAHGQAAAPAPAASASAPAAAGSNNEPLQVIITATRRSTSLQSTPVAVTPLTAADLEKNHVQTVQDVVQLVPSFQATTQGDHGIISMTLRGIGNDAAKTEYADPEVALFVDGIYAPRAEGAAVLLFDMEGIEVLRGPQGTLWGRNSTVGAVNMRTAKPVLGEKFGNLEGGIGNYNRQGLRGAFNVPLSDTLAMRFAFVHEQHDGYVDYQRAPHPSLADQQAAYNAAGLTVPFRPLNPNLFVQNGPKYNAQDQTAARFSLLWQPSRDLTWNVSYEQFLDRGTPSMNLMQTPRAGEKFWSALIDTAPYVHRDVNTVRSRLDWNLSDYLALSYIAGYSHYSGSSDFDQDGGAVVPTSFATGGNAQEDRTNWSKYRNQSHEIQLQSRGNNTVDWIAGLYYAAENNGIRFDIPIMTGTQEGTVAWQGSFIQPKETVDSKAVYGQATWNVNEQLHLTGGARYTRDVRENIGGRNWSWNYDTTNPVPQVPIDPGLDPSSPNSGFGTPVGGTYSGNPQHNDGRYTGSKTTWLARASYDVNKDFMVYGSVSTGYKSGGLQDGGAPYGAETLTNYELGTKNTLFGGRVRFNNAVYYEKFKGFQFSSPVTNPDGTHTLRVANAEGAKVYGFESELAARITDDDRVQIAFAYTHTELGQLFGGSNDYALPPCPVPGIGNCLDVTGHRLPHSPTASGTIQYEHTFRFGDGSTLAPRIKLHHETSSWLSVFNLGEGDLQKAYTTVDLGLRYTAAKDWYVDAYVRNAGDEKVKTQAQNAFGGVWQAQYMAPRTYGVNVGVSF
jgi:iron complex outermembrane receptor protein